MGSTVSSVPPQTPDGLRGPDVAAFLTHPAADRRLSESSQNQALCALVFLYETVLVDELSENHLGDIRALRVRRPTTLPTVLSVAEVSRLLAALPDDTDTGVMARRGETREQAAGYTAGLRFERRANVFLYETRACPGDTPLRGLY